MVFNSSQDKGGSKRDDDNVDDSTVERWNGWLLSSLPPSYLFLTSPSKAIRQPPARAHNLITSDARRTSHLIQHRNTYHHAARRRRFVPRIIINTTSRQCVLTTQSIQRLT